MENIPDGNIEEWQKELDDIYIAIGSATQEELDSVFEKHEKRMSELELLITPPLPIYVLPTTCDCGRGDCWECVYADDPMGI